MTTDIKTIRAAVLAHHGGFEQASDQQIRALWGSLDAATQKRYLAETAATDTTTAKKQKP